MWIKTNLVMVVHNWTWKDCEQTFGMNLQNKTFFSWKNGLLTLNQSVSKMFICNASVFRYNAFLLGTNIDRDYGSFLDCGKAITEIKTLKINPYVFEANPWKKWQCKDIPEYNSLGKKKKEKKLIWSLIVFLCVYLMPSIAIHCYMLYWWKEKALMSPYRPRLSLIACIWLNPAFLAFLIYTYPLKKVT